MLLTDPCTYTGKKIHTYIFFNVVQIFRESDTFKSLPFDMMVKIIYHTDCSFSFFI